MPRPSQKQRVATLVELLRGEYPDAECALEHGDPYELLVATILSAQCTDERVNQVTPALFARFPDPASLAQGSLEEIERLIQSTGFYRNKAKNLKGCAQRLVAEHGGQVPRDLESLVQLPGVGRKTANVVTGSGYGDATGVVVDTHVARLSFRLGLTTTRDPEKIEADLMQLLPTEEWINFSHRLIFHGRRVCNARKPKCAQCVLAPHCPRHGVEEAPSKQASKKSAAKQASAKKAPAKKVAAKKAAKRAGGKPA